MVDRKIINSILKGLDGDKTQFKSALNTILKLGMSVIQNTEELREELKDIEALYLTYVEDLDFQYWIQVSKGNITYGKGVVDNPSIEIYLTQDLISRILKGEIRGINAYLKGIIKARGSLTMGLQYLNFYRMFFRYINEKYKLRGLPG